MNEDFVLVNKIEEIEFNGWVILVVIQIQAIRYKAGEKHFENIMKQERAYSFNNVFHGLDGFYTWKDVFTCISNLNYYVIVEGSIDRESFFLIGPIDKIGVKSVDVKYIDTKGGIDELPTNTIYKSISKVTFGDRYSVLLDKYLIRE